MGCGCSMHKSRIAAAQKTKEQPPSADTVLDAGPMTPETITNGRSPVQASPPQKQEHEFLHGMLPPTSPEENSSCKPAQVAQMSAGSPTRSIAPTVAVSATVALSPAVFLAGSHNSGDSIAIGGVTGDDGGGGAMPGMAPSNGGRQMGGSAELLGSRTGGIDLEGGGISSKKMSVEGFSHPGEPQATLPRFRRQDSLPKIEPSARGSVDLASIPSKGHTLGPGLDFAFREAPTTFGIDAAAHSISGAGKVTSTDGGNPSRAGSVEEGSTDHCRSGLKRHPSDEELVVTAVTPEDTLDEEVLSERRVGGDRWPRANKDVKSLVAAESREYDDGTPRSQEARPALAAGLVGDTDSIDYGGRGGLSVVGYTRDGNSEITGAEGRLGSSDADGTWAAISGAYSLLDAEEEDFMETLLMDS